MKSGTVLLVGWLLLPALPAVADDRATVRFRYACSNDLGRRDVTLFASGSVRLRQGLWESQELYLDELVPEERDSYLAQLREILESADEGVTSLPSEAAQGDWVEKCEIYLALPDIEKRTYHFSGYEIPPLHIARLIHVADDLAEYTEVPPAADRVPADYRPQAGDVLRTAEGERFVVVRWTAGRRAVELESLDSPLRIFVAVDELPEAFAALEAAGER